MRMDRTRMEKKMSVPRVAAPVSAMRLKEMSNVLLMFKKHNIR